MKRILATTALALVMTGGAIIGSVTAAELNTYQSQPTDISASQFIGQRIYVAETMPTTDTDKAGAEKDWADVGEINEVILDPNGSVEAVVLGVGGFLGIGEKNVALALSDVKFVKNGDRPSDYFLVVNTSKEALAAAPAFMTAEEKQAAMDAVASADMTTPADTAATTTAIPTDRTAMDNNAANTTDTTTTASTSKITTMDDTRARLVRPDVTREGYSSVQTDELTADKLEGAIVYGPKDENVGKINRIILSEDGRKIDKIVLEVGNFLGMGTHQIGVTVDELNIVRNADGSDFRVYIDANQANLKAQPEFKG